MSYYLPYYRYTPSNLSYLSTVEAENALRRSRLAAEVAASRVASEVALRRSRV